MDEPQERSARGEPVYRHEERAVPPAAADPDPGLVEAVGEHVIAHLGPVAAVLEEPAPIDVHVDLLHIPPSEGRPCHTFVTCGMSARPMAAPRPALERAELLIVSRPEHEPPAWALSAMRNLAHLPHEYATWLGDGHTVPNGDPTEPYDDGTRLCGAMVVRPYLVPDEFLVLGHDDGPINFYGVAFLHADEMAFKLASGAEALEELLPGAPEVVEPERASVVPRKRRWFGR